MQLSSCTANEVHGQDNPINAYIINAYIINAYIQLFAGWYYVERRSDGGKGWVPISVTREIESSHVRARNYKQRYAFLKLLSNAEDSLTTQLTS
jgi:hypothetical protein